MDRKAEAEGLNAEEAQRRLLQFGPNLIYRRQEVSFLAIARHEVTEPMILLLLFIGVVYSLTDLFDAVTIIIVISLLVLAEVSNEFRAKNAIAALERISAPRTRVVRDGILTEIETEGVVPGDCVILTTGTRIAADGKVSHSSGIQVDESALTGESFPVPKVPGDSLFAGTIVVSGEGDMIVDITGKATRLGRLAVTAETIRPPRTALQLEMKSLAGKLVYIAAFFSILITLVGIFRGNDLRTMILTGLSLSFATIPEELPIIITMVLGLGAYKLSRRGLLVRRLKAAETLGNTTVIVTDKTGTLTESRMMVAALFPQHEREIIDKASQAVPMYSISPIDTAILERAATLGLENPAGEIIWQRDFGDGRKTRTIIRRTSGGDAGLILSGAPEEVFSRCNGIPEDISGALARETAMGRRVIALAGRTLTPAEAVRPDPELEWSLRIYGLISFEDPPRPGVKETIESVRLAGVRTIMVTGDHPDTARAIAQEIGIAPRGARVVTGAELERMSEPELAEAVRTVAIFARTTPEHKYRIVHALQAGGEVVAVTGDGINDALALRGADIGIAMGIRGTDVARDAAEVVLADDNYITITNGIFEGRKFFDNLQKGIRYYLSIKTALILIFLLPVLAGLALPFAPIQIIVLELFMDLGASAGFVAEPAEEDIFRRPPRNPKERIFDRSLVRQIGIRGGVLFAAVMAVYLYAGVAGMTGAEAQTYAFAAWIIGHIVLAYTSRSERIPLTRVGIFSNQIIDLWALSALAFLIAGMYVPVLSAAFRLVPLPPEVLAVTIIAVVMIVGLLELRKYIPHGQGDGA